MEDYSYTLGRAIEEGSMRVCMICHDQITNTEIRKSMASWLSAGAGLRFSVHNACLQEVEMAIEDQKRQEQEAEGATEFVHDLARIARQQQAIEKHR